MLNDAATPNNPKKAGNNPTKHTGHAPPSRPVKLPIKVNPCPLFIFLYSLNFSHIKLIFIPTRTAINILNTKKGITILRLKLLFLF